MSLRILFVSFGSEGDLNPLLWLADGLAARGHEIIFQLTPHYAPLAERRKFRWIPVGRSEDFVEAASDPRFQNRLRGSEYVIRSMGETLPTYREGFETIKEPLDLVVTSSFALAASALAEAAHVPRLTLHLQPVCILSSYDCPLFLDELFWLRHMPRNIIRLAFAFIEFSMWGLAKRPLNRFRQELGLPPLKNFYAEAIHGSEGVAALFPDWFAAPQPDWPPRLRQFGFPLVSSSRPLPDDLQAWLAQGPPPIVWTHGSANFDIKAFQTRALEVSAECGTRCLLVSLTPPEGPLPDRGYYLSHIEFEQLFPHCAAVVHHGGIGTTSKAIAAGCPQIIIPRSHDQPDNARRIVALGLGFCLPYRDLGSNTLPQLVNKLPELSPRCRKFQKRLLAHDPLPALCDWAESLAGNAEGSKIEKALEDQD